MQLYNLLFRTAWRTLCQLAKDPQHLGGQLGAIMVLHTWNQLLQLHPHVHCVIPGGVISPHGSWIAAPVSQKSGKPFLLPVKVVSRLFRGKFLAGLKRLHRKGRLQLPKQLRQLSQERAWNEFLAPVYRKKWVVYGQGPPQGTWKPDAVLKYLARYVAGAAVSDRRLIADDGHSVTFWARQPKQPGSRSRPPRSPMHLSGVKFVERFLIHVLPRGFQRVRYYGLLSNRHRKTKVAQLRALLRDVKKPADESSCDHPVPQPPSCPDCGMGVLRQVQHEDGPTGWVPILLSSPYALPSDWAYWGARVTGSPRSRGDPWTVARQVRVA